MAARRRLDSELVRRELAPSRARARELVESGHVTVGGAPALKPTRMVDPGEAIVVLGDGPRFVSRGGEKLDAALDRFGVDPAGRRVIDVGSSTGGFTDCVLQRGARETVAIDVGRNQLHEKIRADDRVAVHEQTNVRHTSADDVGGAGDLVVADLSFISLRTVAEPILGLARPGADLVLLVKPQFEAGKAEADKGRGVIRDPAVWLDTLMLASGALTAAGAAIMGVMVSPITGGDGNVEFLVHAHAHAEPAAQADLSAWAETAVADAESR
jgi:23S rRNA (cytidine1920-2'-O)/16S rRNA (cytidine1409-2'-O)-methyltransferase